MRRHSWSMQELKSREVSMSKQSGPGRVTQQGQTLQCISLKSLNSTLKKYLSLSAALPEDAETQSMFTAARGIAFLLEEIFGHPSVSFMAPEDQQHLIKALMEGYASLPPSLPGVKPKLSASGARPSSRTPSRCG